MSAVYGNLRVVNKDGSFGASVVIKKTMTLGSSNPANIRVKSTRISAEHARVDVDEKGNCYLVSLTDKNEPKINNAKVKTRSALHNNDRISLGGRVFIFNTNLNQEVSQSNLNQAASTHHATSVEPSKKEVFGHLSLMHTNGSTSAQLKIRGEVIIGREYPSTFRVKSPHVSKQHLKIHIDENRECVLTHLSATNPPIIRGMEVKQATLQHGDKITVGDFVLTFSEEKSQLQENEPNLTNSLCGVLPTNKDDLTLVKNKQQSVLTRKKMPLANKENNGSAVLLNGKQGKRAQGKSSSHQNGSKLCAQETTQKAINSMLIKPDQVLCSFASDGVQLTCTSGGDGSSGISSIARSIHRIHRDDEISPVCNNLPTTSTATHILEHSTEENKTAQLSEQSLEAMREDTKSLLPSGRPSLETMTAQWEFMRDQFLGSSGEALEWAMLSKTGGKGAFKHAKKLNDLAEDQYFKALFDIDMLSGKMKLIRQELGCILKQLSCETNIKVNLDQLRKAHRGYLSGICSNQLDSQIDTYLQNPEDKNLYETLIQLHEKEIHILTDRLQKAQLVSEESLVEMEKWGDRAKKTTACREELISDDALWMETQREENELALAHMRQLIPSNITLLSINELRDLLKEKGGFYSHGLCSEIKRNKLLHLVVTHPDDIAKMNFLAGDSRQYFMDLNLDIVEMRAIRACLPEAFELDKDGQKGEWKERFIVKLKHLVAREAGDLVKGGWDSEAGRRVMVRLPALERKEQRREVYFYETLDQLNKQLDRHNRQETLLSSKTKELECTTLQNTELKIEYDTILTESRNSSLQQLYGTETLSAAKDAAKQDLIESEKKGKTLAADISRVTNSINTATFKKSDLVEYIRQLKEVVPHWGKATDIVPICGVFDRFPVISRVPRVSAVFATADEEAAARKTELTTLKNRSALSENCGRAVVTHHPEKSTFMKMIVPRQPIRTNISIIGSLNNMLEKEAQKGRTEHVRMKKTSVFGNQLPNTKKPTIKSKNLQKIINGSQKNEGSPMCGVGGVARPRPPQLSFLDQLKSMKKPQTE